MIFYFQTQNVFASQYLIENRSISRLRILHIIILLKDVYNSRYYCSDYRRDVYESRYYCLDYRKDVDNSRYYCSDYRRDDYEHVLLFRL